MKMERTFYWEVQGHKCDQKVKWSGRGKSYKIMNL